MGNYAVAFCGIYCRLSRNLWVLLVERANENVHREIYGRSVWQKYDGNRISCVTKLITLVFFVWFKRVCMQNTFMSIRDT